MRGFTISGLRSMERIASIPAFITQLRKSESIAALTLEFCILTATRSNEVLGAKWQEITPKTKIWVIPADRMKEREGVSDSLVSECDGHIEKPSRNKKPVLSFL
jgi:integrase